MSPSWYGSYFYPVSYSRYVYSPVADMEYCKEMIIMDKEQQRLSILEYYVGWKLCNPDHSKAVIKQLMNQGYLRCGITSDIKETVKTTDNGLLYLDLAGIDVGAPPVIGGRICKSEEAAP